MVHSPAPWTVVPLSGRGGPFAIRMPAPAGSRHATHYGVQEVVTIADANLIAAAPELLEALRELTDAFLGTIAGEGFDEEHCECPVLDKARAAIAKAEGRNS